MAKKNQTRGEFGGRITTKDTTPHPRTARERQQARKKVLIGAVAGIVLFVMVAAVLVPLFQ